MRDFSKFSKNKFYAFLNSFIFLILFFPLFFYFKAISNFFSKSILNVFNLYQIYTMQRNKCTSMYAQNMLLNLMMNFNLMKNFLFAIFHEHKIQKQIILNLFSKETNFRVLQLVATCAA